MIKPMSDKEVGNIPGIPTPEDYKEMIKPLKGNNRRIHNKIYKTLADHLGSYAAVRLWMTIIDPASGVKPLDDILAGDAQGVWLRLRSLHSKGPCYG